MKPKIPGIKVDNVGGEFSDLLSHPVEAIQLAKRLA
jgi:hypothetical protein